jgi:hypothetical protein
MSTTVPPLPSETATPGLSEPQRIINTFVAPSKTFEDIRRKASWWVPWLILAIFALGVGVVLNKKIDWEQVVRQQRETGMGASTFQSLSKEQQDQQISIGAKVAGYVVYAAPVFSLIAGLILAAILLATFNFGYAAEVSFGQSMAIVFYSWLPEVIRAIFTVITLLLRSDTEGLNPNNLVGTNVAYFLDKANTSKFVYGMAGALDVITIWTIILVGIGFSVNAKARKLSQGAAIATVAVLYLIYKLSFSAIGLGS